MLRRKSQKGANASLPQDLGLSETWCRIPALEIRANLGIESALKNPAQEKAPSPRGVG